MKKDIKPYNDKNQAHGYHEVYWDNGELDYKGYYKDGKPDGYHEWYRDGKLFYKGNWKDGKMDGYWEWYRSNGELNDIEYFIN